MIGPRGLARPLFATTPAQATIIIKDQQWSEGLRTTELCERLQGLSIDPDRGTPEAFPAYLTAESTKWRDVIRARAIRVE